MVVKDAKAAETLIKLFEKDPTQSYIAETIVNQSREEDATVVESIARTQYGKTDPKYESFLLSLADRIRNTDRCQ
jgi:hypothetical protein